MNLSYLSFYSQYLKSPITIFHKINTNYKVYIIYIFLAFIPYLNYQYIIFFCFFIIYIYFFFIKKNIYIKDFLINKTNFFYIIIFIYYIYTLQYTNKNLLSNIKYISIKIPISINRIKLYYLYFFYKNKCIFDAKILFITYNIPLILIKILLITFLYIQLIQILALSTKYELIIFKFSNLFNKILLIKNKKNHNFFLVVFFTSRMLEKIIFYIYILYLSIKLKYSYFSYSNNFFYIIYILACTYIDYIYSNTIILAYNLWNKKVIINHFFMDK